jgi:hypothetical protein
MNTTTTTPKINLEINSKRVASILCQPEQAQEEKPKPMSVLTAIRVARTMRDEMVEKCGGTVANYVAATDRIIDYLTNPDDRTLANMYLLIVGASLILLGVVVGAVGAYHALNGHDVARVTGLYAAGFFAAGWVSLRGVKK